MFSLPPSGPCPVLSSRSKRACGRLSRPRHPLPPGLKLNHEIPLSNPPPGIAIVIVVAAIRARPLLKQRSVAAGFADGVWGPLYTHHSHSHTHTRAAGSLATSPCTRLVYLSMIRDVLPAASIMACVCIIWSHGGQTEQQRHLLHRHVCQGGTIIDVFVCHSTSKAKPSIPIPTQP